ncbi:uncharacterized protein MELLADRAFT_65780 [Melampsora larici-populina 98AG31]|uniref:Uncharacterized protein n=1 Tax=Melampsora larici-populina (strain 98AG31 / pathotype 3-4-7) TaxID=747676 RepID=F4RWP4_MELLP|nr:uncharacterized protein MELLADRAFT_65780 [Melampsora larici-populina 98AG31]EGG03065.1 hypothetical protein MELLADRAFT_65780 [Melampsora larici-populina 98AG31]
MTSISVKLFTKKSDNVQLTTGGLYSMRCKLIATNDLCDDHLHFNSATRIIEPSVPGVTDSVVESPVNRVQITAIGTIIEKGSYSGAVVWFTKHRLLRPPTMECAKNLWRVGTDVHLSGVVVGYDTEAATWISDISLMQLLGGDAPAVPVPANVGRRQPSVRGLPTRHFSGRRGCRFMGGYNGGGLRKGALRQARILREARVPSVSTVTQHKYAHTQSGSV